jgi:hypothetical protein
MNIPRALAIVLYIASLIWAEVTGMLVERSRMHPDITSETLCEARLEMVDRLLLSAHCGQPVKP